MLPEDVERRDETPVAQGGEARYSDINADGCCHRRQPLLDLALRLDRPKPLAARLAHGHTAYLAKSVPAGLPSVKPMVGPA
jgi:hypothetical protein